MIRPTHNIGTIKTQLEKIAKSKKYKYVYKYQDIRTGEIIWKARIPNYQFVRLFPESVVGNEGEKEAAKAVDLRFIKDGKVPPNNTLKKKVDESK
jgi:hypothetical protein